MSSLRSLFFHISYLSNEDAGSFLLGAWGEGECFLERLCILTKNLIKRTSHVAYVYDCLDALNLFPATHTRCILYF